MIHLRLVLSRLFLPLCLVLLTAAKPVGSAADSQVTIASIESHVFDTPAGPPAPPRVLPGQLTPLTLAEVRAALTNAWRERTHEDPSPQLAALLTSHVAYETGRGKLMRGYNFGNLGCPRGPEGFEEMTIEYMNGAPKRVHARWCTYQNPHAGADAFVSLLLARYRRALAAAACGEPVSYATELRAKNYFSAPLAEYAAGLGGVYAEQLRSVKVKSSTDAEACTKYAKSWSPMASTP